MIYIEIATNNEVDIKKRLEELLTNTLPILDNILPSDAFIDPTLPNTPESYVCGCKSGYSGNGLNCTGTFFFFSTFTLQ